MCNLYSITRSQEAIRRAFRVMRDRAGNLPSLPAIFPDTMAPVVRTAPDGERELTMMRWGFPPPPNLGTAPVTNVRNLKSPYWRGWLKTEWRCLVPATSFCEWTDSRPKVTRWFALDESWPEERLTAPPCHSVGPTVGTAASASRPGLPDCLFRNILFYSILFYSILFYF